MRYFCATLYKKRTLGISNTPVLYTGCMVSKGSTRFFEWASIFKINKFRCFA